jgi:hypothetical protein
MKTSELLHFAFRARDPLALGRWYDELMQHRDPAASVPLLLFETGGPVPPQQQQRKQQQPFQQHQQQQ